MNSPKSEPNNIIKSLENSLQGLKGENRPKVTEAEMIQAVRTLLLGLGENPDREGLKDTPKESSRHSSF